MYYKWLDRWDERRAGRGDRIKTATAFALDTQLAFSGTEGTVGLHDFCVRAANAVSDPTFFEEPVVHSPRVERNGEWITFRSSILTDVEENNVVWARITENHSSDHALIVFHHWNAKSRNPQLAKFFSWHGFAVVEIAMPYHFERSRPSSLHADYMLSPSLGRTIQSMRQAVLDGRKLIGILKDDRYRNVSVLGMSLGSWVAGLIAAHDNNIHKAALLLTAGSLADMVWSGRATRHIRASLEKEIDQVDLQRAWEPLNLQNHAGRLARPELEVQLILAKRDTVVLPELSARFLKAMKATGANPKVLELNCGHYSLSLPQYILPAGLATARFFG